MSPFELSVMLFLQLAIILTTCRVVGWVASYMGQPQVVAEMIAGVLLGPSVLGLFWPEAQLALFPPESKPILFSLCQIGLSLYMFLVGLEFRVENLAQRAKSAVAVSVSGMLVPFALGALLAVPLFARGGYFTEKLSLGEGAVFLGAAMCITAFPMLARIIVERGIAGTSLGTLALAAGAIDDACAWCFLAIVLATFESDISIAAKAIGGGVAYALLLMTIGRSVFRRVFAANYEVDDQRLSWVLMLVMCASWCTDALGIYAVFGAFILGCAMPRGEFGESVRRRVEPLTVTLLLPTFFTYSGLHTRLDLLTTAEQWGWAALALVLACVGKGVACSAAAWWTGESRATSIAIGVLMNARGLMELIILNIGLERNVITPALFSMMVVMAIMTTLMASPLFLWVYRPQGPQGETSTSKLA